MVGSFEIRADLYRYYNRGLRVEEQGLLRHSSKEHSLAKDTKTPIFLLSLLPRSRVTVDLENMQFNRGKNFFQFSRTHLSPRNRVDLG